MPQVEKKTATARWPSKWWRRRDGCSTPFGAGRTMPSSRCRDAGRVIRQTAADPSARPASRIGASMSLYRAGLRLALYLPLGVAMPPAFLRAVRCRVRRCEPRFQPALTSRCDQL